MRWDATRPVPWKRLTIEWALMGLVVAAVIWFGRHDHRAGSYAAVPVAGVVYLGFGAILAKFGYARKTLKQMRVEAAAKPVRTVGRPSAPVARPRPAPTSRTGGGSGNRPPKRKR